MSLQIFHVVLRAYYMGVAIHDNEPVQEWLVMRDEGGVNVVRIR